MINSICTSFNFPRSFVEQCLDKKTVTDSYGKLDLTSCVKHRWGITEEEKKTMQHDYDEFVFAHDSSNVGPLRNVAWWFEDRKRKQSLEKYYRKCEMNVKDVCDVLSPNEYIIGIINTSKTGEELNTFYDIHMYTSFGNVVICDLYDAIPPSIWYDLYGGESFCSKLSWKTYWKVTKRSTKNVQLSDGVIDLIKCYADKYGQTPVDNDLHNRFHFILFNE
jgi:hypothetical protein